MLPRLFAAALLATSTLSATPAAAAELTVISANGMREVINDTKAEFEHQSGHTLALTVVETGAIRKRVLDGEGFDVIMVPSDAADQFAKAKRVIVGSRTPLIRVSFGLAVRADAPHPDTSTADGLRQTFLAAKRVMITDPTTGGISGVHLMGVLDRLGIREEMKPRLLPQRGSGHHAERVVKGEADLAVQAEHEIRCVKGALFLPYPKEFQRSIVFIGSIGVGSANAAAARSYLSFVTGPQAASAIAARCLSRA